MTRTSEEWAALVNAKISQVKNSPAPVSNPKTSLTNHQLAQTIDHTLLKPDATPSQIDNLCDEAIKHNFKVSTPRSSSSIFLNYSPSHAASTAATSDKFPNDSQVPLPFPAVSSDSPWVRVHPNPKLCSSPSPSRFAFSSYFLPLAKHTKPSKTAPTKSTWSSTSAP